MLSEIGYNRQDAVRYAMYWANRRNPRFYDFSDIGGDCTNFVSQCLYAGCGVMNFSPENGWYYIDADNRSPSWTGVSFLRDFLLTNNGEAVYGENVDLSQVIPGDIVQLINDEGRFYHSLFITAVFFPITPQRVFIAAHTDDSRNRPLSSYNYADLFPIHIIGARKNISEVVV